MKCRVCYKNLKSSNLVFVLLIASSLLIGVPILPVISSAADITQTSITIRWTAPGDNGTEGTASQYDIRFSTSPINIGNWNGLSQAADEPDPQPYGNPESYTIIDLIPDTWYYIAIVSADDADNWSGLSNIIAVKTLSLVLDVNETINNIPTEYYLSQNYPNPFNPSTRIEFSIPVTAHVTISIYNILGQQTATLVDEIKAAGNYAIVWNGIDASGLPVSSGIYMYRINAGDFIATKKMALVQ